MVITNLLYKLASWFTQSCTSPAEINCIDHLNHHSKLQIKAHLIPMYFIINTLPPPPVINRKSFSPPYLGLISLSQPCFSSSEINWVDNHLSTSPNYISRCTSFLFTSTPTSHHLYEASLKELGPNSLSLQTLVSPH